MKESRIMDEARQGTADKLIRNVFRYMDKNARDIMTHRKNIVAIDEEEFLELSLIHISCITGRIL